MNKTLIIIGVIVVALILVFQFGFKSTSQVWNSKIRPSDTLKPTKQVENDKFILVKSVKLDYLKQVIEQFCNIYNQETFIALPRLFFLDNEFVITFPYGIDFERFCYFINYLENAHELYLKPDVKAWCTTRLEDAWMNDDIVNKKVMIFIPGWDEEHVNVYLTTQDNLGYKMGFAFGEASQKLDSPAKRFEENPIDKNTLSDKEMIDFE